MVAPHPLAALDREQYVSLTTFRRDGTPVPTPVWFAVDGDTVVVVTHASAGKLKRLRNDPTVRVVPCDARGGVKAGATELAGTARVLDGEDATRASTVLHRKYGLIMRGFELATTALRPVRRRPAEASVHLGVTLSGDGETGRSPGPGSPGA
ncbi:MAG: PPOX class F420-dependent oxidoreductase [Acidimicrobiales bacterium]